jgi:hypothetical protein
MRRLTLTLLAVALAALIVGTAFAQPGRGFGPFGGATPSVLVANKGVQEELKVTDEQKTKLGKINEEMAAKRREAFQDAAGDFEKIQEVMRKLNDTAAKAINEVLQPEQSKRLKQIELQVAGFNAFSREDVQKDLKLTDKQKTEVQDIGKDMQKRVMEMFQGGFDPEKAQENQKKMQAMNKDNLEKVVKSFNDEQKKAWTEMLGKPFNYVPAPFGRRGGGGN